MGSDGFSWLCICFLGQLQPCKAVKLCHYLPSSELARQVAASFVVIFDGAAQTEATQPGNSDSMDEPIKAC